MHMSVFEIQLACNFIVFFIESAAGDEYAYSHINKLGHKDIDWLFFAATGQIVVIQQVI